MIQFVAKTKTFYTPTILVAYGSPWTENKWFENTDVLTNQKLARYIPAELTNGMMRRRPQWFAPEEYNYGGSQKVLPAL